MRPTTSVKVPPGLLIFDVLFPMCEQETLENFEPLVKSSRELPLVRKASQERRVQRCSNGEE